MINWCSIDAAFRRGGLVTGLEELKRQGYVIVPSEPTPDQYVKIMGGGINQTTAQAFYRAMIAAGEVME